MLKLASATPNLFQQVSFCVACDFQSQGCRENNPAAGSCGLLITAEAWLQHSTLTCVSRFC
ncbi:MAG: hypothetical protein WHX60_16550, partial [Armatimonadota bacterium]